eukprot:SAG31_NODE_2335_length_5925_cov_3.925506_7_plen_55_part_00
MGIVVVPDIVSFNAKYRLHIFNCIQFIGFAHRMAVALGTAGTPAHVPRTECSGI